MYKRMRVLTSSPLTLSPRETMLVCIACGCAAVASLMTGLAFGMLISPKKAVSIGCNNGGNTVDNRNFAPGTEEDEECEPY